MWESKGDFIIERGKTPAAFRKKKKEKAGLKILLPYDPIVRFVPCQTANVPFHNFVRIVRISKNAI